jgi:hypothetical protein
MNFRLLLTIASIFISGSALAYDATKALRYPSPDLYRPNVDRLIINGLGSTGDVSSMKVGSSSLGDLFSGAASLSNLAINSIKTNAMSIGATAASGPYLVLGNSTTATSPSIGFRSSGHGGPDIVLGASGGTGASDGTLVISASNTNIVNGKLNLIPAAGKKGLLIQPPAELPGVTGPFSFSEIFMSVNGPVTGSLDSSQQNACACVANFQATLFMGPNFTGGEAVGAAFSTVSYGGSTNPANISDMVGVGSGVAQEYVSLNRLYGAHSSALLGATGTSPFVMGSEVELTVKNPLGTNYRAAFFALNTGPAQGKIMDAAYGAGCSVAGGCWKHFLGLFTSDANETNNPPLLNPLSADGDIIGTERAFTIAHVLNLPTVNVTGNILNFAAVTLSGAGVMVNASTRYYAAAPVAPVGQLAYGGQYTSDLTKCGSPAGAAGCALINAGGTTRYYAFY